MSWTRPAGLRAQVQKLWDRGELLASVVTGESLFPRRLLLKFCVALYQAGIVFLQLFDLLLEQLKLGAQKRDVLLEHDRRAMLNDEPFNFPKDR